jgi:hypothetical protein
MDLIAELQREFGSHLSAELNEWSFAADFGEVMAVIHAEAFINSNRGATRPRRRMSRPKSALL